MSLSLSTDRYRQIDVQMEQKGEGEDVGLARTLVYDAGLVSLIFFLALWDHESSSSSANRNDKKKKEEQCSGEGETFFFLWGVVWVCGSP